MFDIQFFDSIGFKTSGFDELQPYLERAIEEGAKLTSQRALYAYWPQGNGGEIWITLDKEQNVIDYAPYFVGTSSVNVKITGFLNIDFQLAGAIRCEINPKEADGTRFPMMFYVPNYDCVKAELEAEFQKRQGNLNVTVQLTAFATELHCYKTEAEYMAAQTNKYPLAPQHFVPAGLFVPEGEIPGLQVSLAGTVLFGGVLTNPITTQRSFFMSVQTLEMIVDVVADPAVVRGHPKVGGVVSGLFWLSGRPDYEIKRMNSFISQNFPNITLNTTK